MCVCVCVFCVQECVLWFRDDPKIMSPVCTGLLRQVYTLFFVVSQCPITGSVSNFSQFTIAAIFLIWAYTLCKHVTCIHSPGTGKLLKQGHYQGRDLPQGVEGVEWPIIPRSHPVVQYPSHRLQHHHVCACVYYIHMCQYECVHAVCPAPRHSLTEHVHT